MRTKLKMLRVQQNLNQSQMAAKLGCGRAYYGHVERGLQKGSPNFWERLQAACGLTDEQVQELKTID